MSKRDGGFAFPQGTFDGMTMRRWYKGMALAGIRIDNITVEKMAEIASAVADALVAEDKEAEK